MKLVTANRLQDGLVVFYSQTGWTRSIAGADVLAEAGILQAALQAAAADVAANKVVEPYEIDVAVEGGRPVPVRLRERIRVTGPTTGLSGRHAGAPVAARAA